MQAGQTHHRGVLLLSSILAAAICDWLGAPGCQLAVRAAPRSSGSSGGFNVVITGSSKGIGRALAAEFLAAGDNVVVSSRSGQPGAARLAAAQVWCSLGTHADDRVKSTVRELSAKAKGRVTVCTWLLCSQQGDPAKSGPCRSGHDLQRGQGV